MTPEPSPTCTHHVHTHVYPHTCDIYPTTTNDMENIITVRTLLNNSHTPTCTYMYMGKAI